MTELTVYCYIDTMLSQPWPDNNYGSLTNVGVGVAYLDGEKTDYNRTIGNFDVSSIPAGATINSAKMVRNISSIFGDGGSTSLIARLVRHSTWVELEATWNDYASGSAWSSGGAGGSERDTVTPGEITYTEPTSPGVHEVTGLKGYVDDAIANRSDIVALHLKLDDENPGVDDVYNWWSSERSTQAQRWRLVIDYTTVGGQPMERGIARGVERGVGRGV